MSRSKWLAFLAFAVFVSLPFGTAQAQTPATVTVSQNVEFGDILADTSGRTLYLFTNDERDKSTCSDGCATAWPPLLTVGDPTAGEGVAADKLGTITRGDGSSQVTYNGWPLYYFAQDQNPGETNGQYGTWFVVSTHGGPIASSASVNTAENATYGTILVEASGRTLYLFTNDERDKSNCAGGCATAWPPLLTVGDPTAGDGVAADKLGTITRDDGYMQVTYNGWPLYYFAQDEKPGNTNGQYGTWFVVSTHGGPIASSASVNTAENATYGTILVEASGRTLYLFTNDERDKSNCAEGCARAWPPLLTVGEPTVGEGVVAAKVGTITRDDGYMQLTYDGSPLYYFAPDQKPGDTNGQDVGNVWFVVDSAGQAVRPSAPEPELPATGDPGIAAMGWMGPDNVAGTLVYGRSTPGARACNGSHGLAFQDRG